MQIAEELKEEKEKKTEKKEEEKGAPMHRKINSLVHKSKFTERGSRQVGEHFDTHIPRGKIDTTLALIDVKRSLLDDVKVVTDGALLDDLFTGLNFNLLHGVENISLLIVVEVSEKEILGNGKLDS